MNSLKLANPATIDPIRRRLDLQPALRFKLDPATDWDNELIDRLATTGAVEILDLKGRYPRQAPIFTTPDPDLYARVAQAFPNAWLEDPAVTPATEPILRSHQHRITWDAPIRAATDIARQPFPARAINVKPARVGRLRRLLDLYDHCSTAGIPTYGGGMFELGPGRGQIQYLASLFHNTAPNDVAPAAYNQPELPPGTPASPLAPTPTTTGFRWE